MDFEDSSFQDFLQATGFAPPRAIRRAEAAVVAPPPVLEEVPRPVTMMQKHQQDLKEKAERRDLEEDGEQAVATSSVGTNNTILAVQVVTIVAAVLCAVCASMWARLSSEKQRHDTWAALTAFFMLAMIVAGFFLIGLKGGTVTIPEGMKVQEKARIASVPKSTKSERNDAVVAVAPPPPKIAVPRPIVDERPPESAPLRLTKDNMYDPYKDQRVGANRPKMPVPPEELGLTESEYEDYLKSFDGHRPDQDRGRKPFVALAARPRTNLGIDALEREYGILGEPSTHYKGSRRLAKTDPRLDLRNGHMRPVDVNDPALFADSHVNLPHIEAISMEGNIAMDPDPGDFAEQDEAALKGIFQENAIPDYSDVNLEQLLSQTTEERAKQIELERKRQEDMARTIRPMVENLDNTDPRLSPPAPKQDEFMQSISVANPKHKKTAEANEAGGAPTAATATTDDLFEQAMHDNLATAEEFAGIFTSGGTVPSDEETAAAMEQAKADHRA